MKSKKIANRFSNYTFYTFLHKQQYKNKTNINNITQLSISEYSAKIE